MAIDFPSSPTNGQEFSSGSVTWTYDGTAWNLKSTAATTNDSMPIGAIMWFANTTTTPPGWLAADGSNVSRTTYAALFAVIGTTYGSGDGSTTFGLPNISATTGKYYVRYTTALGTQTTTSLSTAPVGTMLDWPTTSSYPTGYLRADGSAVSRTSYADLFALVGTAYGSGDGSTTFNLPNLPAAGAGSPVSIIKASLGGIVEPSTVAHAVSHTEGGSDVITVTGNQIANYQTYRNLIINGDMRVAQRYTSKSFGSGGGGIHWGADRFFTVDYTWSAGSNITVSRDATVVPSGQGFNYSYKIATGATGLTFASGGWLDIEHIVEGYNIAAFHNKPLTLSFWVRSSVTGTYSLTFGSKNPNSTWTTSDRIYVAAYTINAANTWEKKTVSIDMSSATSAGTWDTTNGKGLGIAWGLGSHSDRRTDQYNSGWANWSNSFIGWQRTTQTQWATNSNATFYLTGIQLEQGTVATPFEFEPIESSLRKCQRYFEKTYALETPLGTNTGRGHAFAGVSSDAFSNALYDLRFKVPKRISDSVISVWTSTGTANVWDYSRSGASGTTAPNWTSDWRGESGGLLFFGVGAAFVPCVIRGHWACDAEL